MLIYEKNNKLNMNFDPLKTIEDNPDIVIGENEIKLGDTEITSENVLPTPTSEDVGKVPTVQEDGSYALANAGGGSEPFVVTFTQNENTWYADKTYEETKQAFLSGSFVIFYVYGWHAFVEPMYMRGPNVPEDVGLFANILAYSTLNNTLTGITVNRIGFNAEGNVIYQEFSATFN